MRRRIGPVVVLLFLTCLQAASSCAQALDDRRGLLAPWTQDAVSLRAAVDRTVAEGGTALRDAAFSAISLRDGASGRMLLILFSDGLDTVSWLTAGDLLAAAERTDVSIHVVQTLPVPRRVGADHRRQLTSNPQLHEMLLLPVLASETGGAAVSVYDSSNVRSAFLKIIDDFRAGYVLTYSPEGVPKEGWHSIDVRLKRTRGDVRARRELSSREEPDNRPRFRAGDSALVSSNDRRRRTGCAGTATRG
jgi:VWFA-related protein